MKLKELMRLKELTRSAVVLLIIVLMFLGTIKNTYAEVIDDENVDIRAEIDEGIDEKTENNLDKKPLKVNITTETGENILLKDGEMLYTSKPLVFICEKFQDEEGGKYYYCVSLDGGENFGGYVQIDDESIVLYPEENEESRNNYVLRFMYKNNAAVMERVSKEFHVQFDRKSPKIVLKNEELLNGWIDETGELLFEACDEDGFIGRILAFCGEEVIFEQHFSNDDSIREYEFSVVLHREASSKDGANINIKIIDLAGNTFSSDYTYYLDKEAPILVLNGMENGGMNQEDVHLQFIADDNCDSKPLLVYQIERECGGEIVTDEIAENINVNESKEIVLDCEGRYRINAYCQDGAGHISESIYREFTIDKEPPKINITGVSTNVDMKNPSDVVISVSENFYDNCNVSITAVKRKGDELTNLPLESFVMSAPMESRQIKLKNDGDYEIYVSAIDGLGRESTAITSFRIDKNPPQLSIRGLVDGQVTNDKPVLTINSGECFYDSTIVDAKLMRKIGEDCYSTVDEKKYVMRSNMDSQNIEVSQEGEYELICQARDRTGNETSKKVKFTVDYTPPVIGKLDDVDGKYLKSYTFSKSFLSSITDMTKYTVDSFINNDKLEGDEVIVEEGKYSIWIGATDEAENFAEESATFIVDHTAPSLVVSGIRKDGNIKKGNVLSITLANEDDELTKVLFNGQSIELLDNRKRAEIVIEEYGDYRLEVMAEDKAGNTTDKIISTSCYASVPPINDYLYKEKIVHNIGDKIVKNDRKSVDVVGMLIGCFIVLVGITGLMISEIVRATRGISTRS